VERLRSKPFIIAGVAAALLLGLVAVQFARPSKARSARLERYLPADAVGFVEVTT